MANTGIQPGKHFCRRSSLPLWEIKCWSVFSLSLNQSVCNISVYKLDYILAYNPKIKFSSKCYKICYVKYHLRILKKYFGLILQSCSLFTVRPFSVCIIVSMIYFPVCIFVFLTVLLRSYGQFVHVHISVRILVKCPVSKALTKAILGSRVNLNITYTQYSLRSGSGKNHSSVEDLQGILHILWIPIPPNITNGSRFISELFLTQSQLSLDQKDKSLIQSTIIFEHLIWVKNVRGGF